MMNFGNPFAGKEALVNALRGGSTPAGGGMVERAQLRRSGVQQAVPDYSKGMGVLGDAMKYKRMRDIIQREKNLSQGLTPTGGYMGDVNVPGSVEGLA